MNEQTCISLPLILGGPQIRRRESNQVWFWLATSEAVVLGARLYVEATMASLDSITVCSTQTVRLGERLYVHLIRVSTNDKALPEDELLCYDILIDGESLIGRGLLNVDDIALPGFSRPSFVIPTRDNNILMGSCRKPHGGTPNGRGQTEDALAYGAEILAKSARDLERRPSALLGLGDQIYADDVAGALLEGLKDIAAGLIGHPEMMPTVGDVAAIGFGARQQVIRTRGLTSHAAEHHLLSLGEFCAMYLVVLGGLDCVIPAWPPASHGPYKGAAERTAAELAYNGSAAMLKTFLAGTKAVRRLLANIASYNIFDDHEVTDDWNLDAKMHRTLTATAFGRSLLCNALLAYWAFQGWGNNPSDYPQDFLDAVDACMNDPTDEQAKLGLEKRLSAWCEWRFVAPTNPPIIFLDARTQRSYHGLLKLPRLQNKVALDWVSSAISGSAAGKEIAYIVAPTPVYGFTPVEYAQGVVKRILTIFHMRAVAIDCESWITVREGFSAFMRCLLESGVKQFVILSGDVHYGFVKSGVFEYKEQTCSVTQICSSALHNHPPSAAVLLWLGLFDEITERRVGFVGRGLWATILRWARAFVIDMLVFWKLWRPSTKSGQAWFDIARVLPIGDRESRVLIESHIGSLNNKEGVPVAYEMRHPSEVKVARILL